MIKLSKKFIEILLDEMNEELKKKNIIGELYIVGGAAMCLAFNARPSTNDVDAFFVPKKEIYNISKKIADKHELGKNWLNDAVKGFFSENGKFDSFMDKDHLKVYMPTPEYLFSMKSLSMRLGKEFTDESDLKYLLKYLNITNLNEAIKIISKFYDKTLIPPKTYYALEEMIEEMK